MSSDIALPRLKVNRFEDLVREFDTLKGWIFRGHCSSGWKLRSTLERRNPPGDNPVFTEFNIVREFQRRAHNHVDSQHIPTTPGEWLALMQHFGAPTRLIDFTRSPFVAAYFAFEEVPPDDSPECALIALSPSWFHQRLGGLALARDKFFGFPIGAIREGVSAMKKAGWEAVPDDLPAGTLMAAKIEEHALDHTGEDVVAVFEPHRLSERMDVQQGAFLWPGRVDKTVSEILSGLGDLREGVCEYVIPVSERGRAIEQLRLMNITRASLFPGLDGFAHSFRYLAVRESDKSRALRLAIAGITGAGGGVAAE